MRQRSFQGGEIRVRREELGLSVEDVYRKLRIPAGCVRAIEEGAAHRLPEMCYALGYLRTYCLFLDLDPEPFVDELRECRRPAARFLGIAEKDRARPPWVDGLLAWAAISAVLLLGWVAYAVVLQPETEPSESRVQAGTVDMRVPEPPSAP